MAVSLLWAGSLLPSSLVPSRATTWGQPVPDTATSQTRLTWSDPAWFTSLGEWKNPQPYQNNSGRLSFPSSPYSVAQLHKSCSSLFLR